MAARLRRLCKVKCPLLKLPDKLEFDCLAGKVYFICVMFNDEVKKMLIQVITSWQVLVVTVVLVIYIFLVNAVARIYHRRPPRQEPIQKAKPAPAEAPAPEAVSTDSDDLGLEEEETEEK